MRPPAASDLVPALVLLGHGSRDPAWRESMDRVAVLVRQQQAGREVRCAFLELCEPSLDHTIDELVAAGHACITVLPMLLGVGHHLRSQLPQILNAQAERHPSVRIELRPALGDTAAVLQAIADSTRVESA